MPWQECRKMDERMRFVARLLDDEKMAALCRKFDVSRILEDYGQSKGLRSARKYEQVIATHVTPNIGSVPVDMEKNLPKKRKKDRVLSLEIARIVAAAHSAMTRAERA